MKIKGVQRGTQNEIMVDLAKACWVKKVEESLQFLFPDGTQLILDKPEKMTYNEEEYFLFGKITSTTSYSATSSGCSASGARSTTLSAEKRASKADAIAQKEAEQEAREDEEDDEAVVAEFDADTAEEEAGSEEEEKGEGQEEGPASTEPNPTHGGYPVFGGGSQTPQ